MQSLQCMMCRNYIGNLQCKAFNGQIPYAILSGRHDHREPFRGDNGIRFEQKTLNEAPKPDEIVDE